MPHWTIATAMPKEVSSTVKASVLDEQVLVHLQDCWGLRPSPAHDLSSRSIFGKQTRPQGSPDLEAMPTSGY